MKKVILVTAANSRLGSQITKFLANKGNLVYAGFHENKDHIISHKNIKLINLDVTNKNSVQKAVSRIINKSSSLDVVINVAGITISKPVNQTEEFEFKKILDINVISHLILNNIAFAQMSKQIKGGRIVNITSMSGLVSLPNFSIYSASKFAAQSLGEVMHYEFLRNNVLVTNIIPGAINFGDKVNSQKLTHKTFRQKFPILTRFLRMATPQDISKNIYKLINSEDKPVNVVVGADVQIVYSLYRFLPSKVWEKLVTYYFNKK